MNSKFVLFIIASVMTLVVSAQADVAKHKDIPVAPGLQEIIAKHNHKANIGVIVQSMKTGKILYQKNASRLYTPASVQKLFTAIAALAYLKPDFRFTTTILTNGIIKEHVLRGNLYIKFSGDPLLKRKVLAHMFSKLHHLGVQRIAGRVYIDNTAYGFIPYPPGYIWDDLSYSYAAPLNAIILNRNKFVLQLIPSNTKRRVQLQAPHLPNGVARFTNRIILTKSYNKDCPLTLYSDGSNHYTIAGCFYRRLGKQVRSLAIRNMPLYARAVVRDLLKENNIRFKGPVTLHKAPKIATPLVMHYSKPLAKIVRRLLKKSDNLITNSLLKKLGQQYFKTRGTWQNGLRAMKKILSKSAGIDFKKNLLSDGAGLSRYNLFTPNQLMKLLRYGYYNPTVRPALLAALPIAGKDGTLEGRMISLGKSQRIHAKTGSMTGVTSLAGYIVTKRNGILAFVIMINNFVGKRRPFIRLEDHICTFLVNAKKSQ